MKPKTPEAEINIDKELAKLLIESQHPDLSHLPLAYLNSGWDNTLFTLGAEYIVRLPRRKVAAQLLENEQKWLPIIAEELPIQVPKPYRVGKPDKNYPWHWSITPWYKGQTADEEYIDNDQAFIFAQFLKKLHTPSPKNAPKNPLRGIPLINRKKDVESWMSFSKSKTNLLTKEIEQIWEKALDTDTHKQDCWIHGDLHPCNVIIDNNKIQAIIDWGDIASGDPATDLSSTWMLFHTSSARNTVIKTYNPSQALVSRAKGWSIFFGTFFLASGLNGNQKHYKIGGSILKNLNQDEVKIKNS
ncbi:aminoglycoside phosphotransferase family protein [Aquimarina mytili]|uniref:Aminoglycoside phosphotransferase family protein n=1 Tax=Aquimarina mytili TaxID=874423 RepID=A0A937D8U9_9FLAO|nr:aminoglycoside phosphotransferase family protein [Aquimarina mytili]MBL0684430.1 aminoglycoside phosphotransferase family protein [Aquimarina mytili]